MTGFAPVFVSPFSIPRSYNRGVSDTAANVRRLLSGPADVSNSIERDLRGPTLEALYEVFAAASVDNWDGEGSAVADSASLDYAFSFVESMPTWVPAPDVYVDRDGELCLEWDEGPRRVVSVSVARDGTLTYAGLVGARRRHGVELFTDSVPTAVASALGLLFGRAGA